MYFKSFTMNLLNFGWPLFLTRPDTRLPQSHAGGQGPQLRSLHHLGGNCEAKDRKNPKKVKCDGPRDGWTDRRMDWRTDGRTDGRTDKAGCSTRLKMSEDI